MLRPPEMAEMAELGDEAEAKGGKWAVFLCSFFFRSVLRSFFFFFFLFLHVLFFFGVLRSVQVCFFFLMFFSPTAESFGVLAKPGPGALWGSHPDGFRQVPRFQEGFQVKVPAGSEVPSKGCQ